MQGTPLAAKSLAQQPTRKAPAGWYDDPTMVNTRRYWDGQKWTPHRREVPPPSAAGMTYSSQLSTASAPEQGTRTLFHWGIAMAILLPIVGLIIGVVLLGKKPTWGVRVIAGSIGFTLLYYNLST
jgi:hypothetical protein